MDLSEPIAVSDVETARLARLRALDLLDTDAEPVFDALAAAAAAACGVPIALLSLVDRDRQWFKANVGLDGVSETPRDVAFCSHAIQSDALMVVEDARNDGRFAENPLVTGNPEIRFYAGAPITLSDGMRLGTLCAIDRVPRKLDAKQQDILRNLARAAVAALEMRESSFARLKQAEHAQARVARLYQATPAMLHSVDARGRLVSVSDTWLNALGYARDEVLGRHAYEFMTRASAENFRTIILPEFFRAGQTTDLENQMVRKDGSVIDVSISAVIDRDERQQPCAMAVVQDITARKIAEMRLLESRNDLMNILEGTNAGTWKWNVQTGEAHFNERWAEIAGYTLAELEPVSIQTWADLVHPDDAARSSTLIEKHFAGELPYYDCAVRMRHKDGHWVWVHDRGKVAEWDEDGKPHWMMGTHTDITSSKGTERELLDSQRALAESREMLQVTLASIGDAVITTDLDGLIQWLNPAAEQLSGWSSADAQGRPVHEVLAIVDEDSRGPVEIPISRCFTEGRTSSAERTALISRRGGEYGIQYSVAPIRDHDGLAHGAVLVLRDVSEQRRANREMQVRATYDVLTGLFNRSEFETRLARVLRQTHAEDTRSALMFIDLDHFKKVNDSCGHAAGDELLKQIANVLRARVRSGDTLARLGGDEFAVILECCPIDQAVRVGQSICAAMEEFVFEQEGTCYDVGASIGIAVIDRKVRTGAAAVRAADEACYAAKKAGRNCVRIQRETSQEIAA